MIKKDHPEHYRTAPTNPQPPKPNPNNQKQRQRLPLPELLADVPPELEWLANIENPRTGKAYKTDVGGFMAFSGIRCIPAHPAALGYIDAYLTAAGHCEERDGAIFRPVRNNVTGDLTKPLSATGIYSNVILHYTKIAGIYTEGICTHAMRATAATNALDHKADIAKVQEWLGHANVSTTKLYDKRGTKVEESPTFKVEY